MRAVAIGITLLCLVVRPAAAQTLTAVRPGLMCTSAKALAVLTERDGSSRADSAKAKPGDAALKRRGGCIDIPPGAIVSLVRRDGNVSIVTYTPQPSRNRQFYFVPNVDFNRSRPGSA